MAKIRLTDKKIEDVLKTVCGEDTIPLVKKLKGKDNISEFQLATQLKKDIKKVRNILYRLYDSNLVSFTRKKDKKKGWYIYYWTFKPEQVRFLYEKTKKEWLEQLKERLKREETGQFFICPTGCVRMDFEQAVNFEYRCPECGELVSIQETKEKIKDLKKEITELEKEVKKLSKAK